MLSADEDDSKSKEQEFVLVEDTKNSKEGLKIFRGNLE